MNEDILEQFDELPSGSVIINNGDLTLSSKANFDKMKAFTDRMRQNDKRLWIVLGNHDRDIMAHAKALKSFGNPYELFLQLGFERVFPFPILLEEKYLLSHEPVYLKPGSNIMNIYGHTHDCKVTEDYFCRECENFAMMERVKKEMITKQVNLDIDTDAIKDPTLVIDTKNYYNVCWDLHHRILPFKDVISSF